MIHAFYGNFVVFAVSTIKSYPRWRNLFRTHVLIARATFHAHSTTELKIMSSQTQPTALEGLFQSSGNTPFNGFSSLDKNHSANTPALNSWKERLKFKKLTKLKLIHIREHN